jgi:hypothetical protein
MKFIRIQFIKVVVILISGLTFLNMSFILTELNALGLGKHSTLFQNIVNAGIEEEKETDSCGENDCLENEEYLSFNNDFSLKASVIELKKLKFIDHNCSLFDSGFQESFSPPPEELFIYS